MYQTINFNQCACPKDALRVERSLMKLQVKMLRMAEIMDHRIKVKEQQREQLRVQLIEETNLIHFL